MNSKKPMTRFDLNSKARSQQLHLDYINSNCKKLIHSIRIKLYYDSNQDFL